MSLSAHFLIFAVGARKECCLVDAVAQCRPASSETECRARVLVSIRAPFKFETPTPTNAMHSSTIRKFKAALEVHVTSLMSSKQRTHCLVAAEMILPSLSGVAQLVVQR